MKKNVCVISLLLSALLLFCSCKAPSAGFEPRQVFTARLTASGNGREFQAEAECSGAHDLTVRFTAPEALKGFTVHSVPEGFEIDAFGIRDFIASSEIGEDAFLGLLFKAVSGAVCGNGNGYSADRKTGEISSSFSVGEIPVRAVFGEDGILRSLSAPSVGFSAEFTQNG